MLQLRQQTVPARLSQIKTIFHNSKKLILNSLRFLF